MRMGKCVRVHRGVGAQAWVFCPTCLWPQEQPGSRDSFQNLCLTFPLKHKTTH